jgi:excisionase family DNA binding protein
MQKRAYSIDESCEITGLGKTAVYNLIDDKALNAKRQGRRTVISAGEVDRYISSLPDARPRAKKKPSVRPASEASTGHDDPENGSR